MKQKKAVNQLEVFIDESLMIIIYGRQHEFGLLVFLWRALCGICGYD